MAFMHSCRIMLSLFFTVSGNAHHDGNCKDKGRGHYLAYETILKKSIPLDANNFSICTEIVGLKDFNKRGQSMFWLLSETNEYAQAVSDHYKTNKMGFKAYVGDCSHNFAKHLNGGKRVLTNKSKGIEYCHELGKLMGVAYPSFKIQKVMAIFCHRKYKAHDSKHGLKTWLAKQGKPTIVTGCLTDGYVDMNNKNVDANLRREHINTCEDLKLFQKEYLKMEKQECEAYPTITQSVTSSKSTSQQSVITGKGHIVTSLASVATTNSPSPTETVLNNILTSTPSDRASSKHTKAVEESKTTEFTSLSKSSQAQDSASTPYSSTALPPITRELATPEGVAKDTSLMKNSLGTSYFPRSTPVSAAASTTGKSPQNLFKQSTTDHAVSNYVSNTGDNGKDDSKSSVPNVDTAQESTVRIKTQKTVSDSTVMNTSTQAAGSETENCVIDLKVCLKNKANCPNVLKPVSKVTFIGLGVVTAFLVVIGAGAILLGLRKEKKRKKKVTEKNDAEGYAVINVQRAMSSEISIKGGKTMTENAAIACSNDIKDQKLDKKAETFAAKQKTTDLKVSLKEDLNPALNPKQD